MTGGERDLGLILDNPAGERDQVLAAGSAVEIAWSRLDEGASLRVHNAGGPLGEEEASAPSSASPRRVLEPPPGHGPRPADRRGPGTAGRRRRAPGQRQRRRRRRGESPPRRGDAGGSLCRFLTWPFYRGRHEPSRRPHRRASRRTRDRRRRRDRGVREPNHRRRADRPRLRACFVDLRRHPRAAVLGPGPTRGPRG